MTHNRRKKVHNIESELEVNVHVNGRIVEKQKRNIKVQTEGVKAQFLLPTHLANISSIIIYYSRS